MSTICSSMESHKSLTKYSSYTKRKHTQTMLSNVATNTIPRPLFSQVNTSTSRVTNDILDLTTNRKRRENSCDEQVVPNKISKLKDQAAACSKEKSLEEHSNAVDKDEVVVIYDSSSNSVSNQNGNIRSSDVVSIKSNTRLNHNNHTDCNMFICTSNCRNKQSENVVKDGRIKADSRKYGKTTSNANSTITTEQYYGLIESNQNDISLSSSPYLVDIGDTVIKMEKELQITDKNEDAVWNSINVFSMPIVSPIDFEQVRPQLKTEFSEEDVVTLSDTEENTIRYFQLFDGYSMKTSMNQDVTKEVIEMEAKAEPDDAGISSCTSDTGDGSVPYPRSFDKFDMNVSINQETEPEDSGISLYSNEDVVGSSSDSDDEDYRNWMRKLSRSRMLNKDKLRKKAEKKIEIEKERSMRHKDEDEGDRTVNEMNSQSITSMGRIEVNAVDRAISLRESTSDSTISHKNSFNNKTPNSLGSRRQGNDSRPISGTTELILTRIKKLPVRKALQIEPLHMPTRRRSNRAKQDPEKPPKERVSSKEKEVKETKDQKEDRKKDQKKDRKKDQKKRRAQNESPDCLSPSKKKASPEKRELMDDGKKELKEKDQKKCKAQNECAAQKTNPPLAKEQKKQLIDNRKQKLKEIALNKLAGKDVTVSTKSMNYGITNMFLLKILKWHPNWIEQQKSHLRLDKTAPIIPVDELHEMLTHYKSYDEYYRVMLPRMLLETWYTITRSFPPIDNCGQPTRVCSIIENSMQIKALPSNQYLTTLMLEVLVTREDREKKAYPSEGDLVFFEYPVEEEGQTLIKVFAYVDNDRSTILLDSTHYNKELANYVEKPYALITYTIRTKPLRPNILVNGVAKITRVTKLRHNLNMVQALEYLPKSPLMNLILSPKIKEYCLPTIPIHSEQLFTQDKLNKKQLEAVFKVTETIVQNQTKLCFIQGPSGTGKSTVIVNIVTQVLYKKKRYASSEGALKILVCAPTNAAIDEITLRLLQIRSSMKQNRFNIVRIGQTGVTNPIVKNISMTELTKEEINRMRTSSENNMCNREKKMTCLNVKESVRIQQDAETAVLNQADIITCTQSSIYSKQTEAFFMNNKKGISVCIMDEATQSTEAETLIPLMLGVNTLVLVGDPTQLPVTVPSPRGKIEGRDQSIYSRVQNAFEMNPANPIITLDTQYRMSRDICQWPSKFLYAGNLETGTPPNEEFPFHSYRLFNIYNSVNEYNSNIAEAQFVANMMYTMLTQANFDGWECISYGILTPYNNQKPVILAKINDKLSLLPEYVRKRIKFEVSTIDGFRGKERDVVILSCVRSQQIGCLSDKQRLGVALTRAKHSLIICGNIGLFNKDPNWKSLLTDAKSRNVYFNVNAEAESWEIKHHVVKRCRCGR